jgi:hypothetical protein
VWFSRGTKAVRLTYDHKGSDQQEAQRITDAGGYVMNNRVNGLLLLAAAFLVLLSLTFLETSFARRTGGDKISRRLFHERVCRRFTIHDWDDARSGRPIFDYCMRWCKFHSYYFFVSANEVSCMHNRLVVGCMWRPGCGWLDLECQRPTGS